MLDWADTFNRYGTNTAFMLDGLYAAFDTGGGTPTLVADPDTTATGNVFKVPSSSGFFTQASGARMPYLSTAATKGAAVRLYMSQLPYGDDRSPVLSFRDVSNNTLVCLRVLSTGALQVWKGADSGTRGSGTLLGTSTLPAVTAHAWAHIEMKVKSDAATGTVEVRVNGRVVAGLNLTGQNTGGATIAQLFFGANNYANATDADSYYWKDLVMWDITGTENNDFLGTILVLDSDPNGDSSFTWTASTGTNGWSILDNNPPLDDAAYISAATPLLSRFNLTDLPADVTSVRGGILVARARKIDGGDGNLQMGIVSGASVGLGTDRPITTAYTYWRDVFEVDPATGTAFTPSGFNAALFQLARTL